jgi:hypothetical protein
LPHRVPVVSETIDPLPFQHQESVLHHVDLDESERRSGLVSEDVDGEVEPLIAWQQHLEDGIRIAQERCAFNIALIAAKRTGDGNPGPTGIPLLEKVEAGRSRA